MDNLDILEDGASLVNRLLGEKVQAIKDAGIVVVKVNRATIEYDASIILEDKDANGYHVQVGPTYAHLIVEEEGKTVFTHIADGIPAIIEKAKEIYYVPRR